MQRILEVYRRRASEIPRDAYSLTKPVNLFFAQQRERHALSFLRQFGLLPLEEKRALEVGCGSRGWLPTLESWWLAASASPGSTSMRPAWPSFAASSAVGKGRGGILSPGADLRAGDASRLPWPDASFDLVLQSTVFSSILDSDMRRAVAAEMRRVLKPGGLILWYDFFYNNPQPQRPGGGPGGYHDSLPRVLGSPPPRDARAPHRPPPRPRELGRGAS